MRKHLQCLAAFAVFGTAWGWAVDVGTSVAIISHEGTNQVLGSFTLNVRDNDFSNASEATPVYVRFQLSSAQGWAKTLVDMRPDAPSATQHPINIALYSSISSTINPNLPDNTVQLVRLIEGEKAGWLRITRSTDTWLLSGGNPTSPTANRTVSMTIGISGENSVRNNANTASGGNEDSNTGFLRSTILRADYRNTPNFGIDDLENLDFIAFDHTTSGVISSSPREGRVLPVGFSNDSAIARGDGLIPCFEYHFQPDDLDGLPHQVTINRMNLAWRDTYCVRVPEVFLTNSSDFQWFPGSRFFLTLQDFDPFYLVGGGSPPFTAPEPDKIQLTDADIKVTTPNTDAVWAVEKIYVNNLFMGYELRLESGIMDIWESLTLDGLSACTEGWFNGSTMVLRAGAFYTNPEVTGSELKGLSPWYKGTVVVKQIEDNFQRTVLPYTGYDRDDWETEIRIINPGSEPVLMTAFFYQRQGIHTRSFTLEKIPGYGMFAFDLRQTFGEEFGSSLTWMELLSNGPLEAIAIVRSKDGQTMDIFNAVTGSQHNLYGSHLPSDTDTWQATSYIVASEYDIDSSFQLQLQGENRGLSNLRAPRYTLILEDGDFQTSQGRSPWFQVNASEQAASGLVFIERRDNGSQLVSLPLNDQPAEEWEFDHLGNPGNGWWNGLILYNPGSVDTTVALTIDSADGGESNTSITLPAQSKQSSVVSDLLSVGQTPERLFVESDTTILAGLLMGRQDQEILTYIPGNSPAGKGFISPYIHGEEGHWTGLALINLRGNPARGTITPLDSAGLPGTPINFAISPRSKELILLDAPMDYTHLLIESDQNIKTFGITGADGLLATIPVFPIR